MTDVKMTIVHVEGLQELEEAFTQGSRRVVRKFLRTVEMRAANVLKVALSENAPWESGASAEDIHAMTVVGDGFMNVRVGPSQRTFYEMFQEFGAPEANVPALHWMEMAAVSKQNAVLKEYFKALTDGLEEMKK